jgi:hypothetical protein
MGKWFLAIAFIVVATGVAIFATSHRTTHSNDFVTKRSEEKTVTYARLGVSTTYHSSPYKRDVPLNQRQSGALGGSRMEEEIVIHDFLGPGRYSFSFSTNTPGCSSGSGEYTLPAAFERIVPVNEIHIGITFNSIRFPDCVRLTITNGDESDWRDFNFSEFK